MMTTLQFFRDDFLAGGISTTTDFVQSKTVNLSTVSYVLNHPFLHEFSRVDGSEGTGSNRTNFTKTV